MSAWNIQVPEVQGVLTTVSGQIGDEDGSSGLTGDSLALGEATADCEDAAGSVPISAALGEFAEYVSGLVGGVVELTASAVGGAGEATSHYVAGDLEMASEAQDNIGEVPDPQYSD
ncbi:DUF6507 family protein [Nocardiopsis salina]|uniref:DUF6507 family protein n=1 Tax=Nocardiopsis salina TaxID=245836 RepID=UPI00034D7839|nr:DUF6507 family protein [Nocardiopsis salina]